MKILIIGFGKLGSNLYYSLSGKKGIQLSAVRSSREKLSAGSIEAADVIFICTRDSQIPAAVKHIAASGAALKNKVIFHTSGSLTSDELKKLSTNGAFIASFHPVQTFEKRVRKDAGRFDDIYIALEGSKKAINTGASIARQLSAKPFTLKKENKVYHHICCVIASNFLAALNRQIEKIISKKIRINGFKNLSFFNIYMPLATQSLKNIAKSGTIDSLTGPFERNDVITIEKHLKALSNGSKDVLSVYLLMGIETVKLSLEKKSLSHGDSVKIMKLLSKYLIK